VSRRLVQMRLPPELIAWTDAYAAERLSTRTAIVEAALHGFRYDAETGVPDLRSADHVRSGALAGEHS
jgi:hypothetical protein